MLLKIVILLSLSSVICSQTCNHRTTESGFLCICNATYCDSVPELEKLTANIYQIYTTSKSSPGFSSKQGNISKTRNASIGLVSVTKDKHQKILGFGGAFTDSTGINIKSLPTQVQEKLLESYFGSSGIEYSLCRVPVGGCDFSPRPYSYDAVRGDVNLVHFALQKEDLTYKIPIIKKAISLKQKKPFRLFASAWTAPPWMKTHNIWTGYSLLQERYYQTFANYMKKFFEKYSKNGIDFWGLTTGNEPINGFKPYTELKINSMGWLVDDQARWLSENLGPTLQNSTFKDLKIMIHDDGRLNFAYVVPPMLKNKNAMKYIDGVAVHWYFDSSVSEEVLDLVDYKAKDVFLLMTEACVFRSGMDLGSWDRGARYITSIFEYLNHGSAGWIDWNMALNAQGGPTYIGYPADSPIIVNADKGEFYKQPMYYAIGHFSKFVIPESIRVGTKSALLKDSIHTVAFSRPDKLRVVIIYNSGSEDVKLQVEEDGLYSDVITVQANSINTAIYRVI